MFYAKRLMRYYRDPQVKFDLSRPAFQKSSSAVHLLGFFVMLSRLVRSS